VRGPPSRGGGAEEERKMASGGGKGGGSLEEQVQSHVNLLREAHRLAMRQGKSGGESPVSDSPVQNYLNPLAGGSEESPARYGSYKQSPRPVKGAREAWGATPSAPSPFTKHVQALLARGNSA